LFALNPLKDFFPVDSDLARRVYAQPYLIAFDTEHCDSDIVANDHRLPNPPGQDQHSQTPSRTSDIRGLADLIIIYWLGRPSLREDSPLYPAILVHLRADGSV
jgi:hypothetical protein